jgi:glycosyltransferase involved in cell wall biosynthesis
MPQATRPRKVAICLQDLAALHDMLARGHAVDGTYVVQGYVAAGLARRGHDITFIAPRGLAEVEYGRDPGRPVPAPRTWSSAPWFDLASRIAWKGQQLAGIPYLNVFTNYRLLDACLRCLPGHDVVYERNALYSAAVARACGRLRLPYVMFFEADQLLELDYAGRPVAGLLRSRAEQLLRENLALATSIIVVSEPAKRHLLARWPVDAAKVVVCPNGVDTGLFRPNPDARVRVRASLGLRSEPLLLFTGSFFDWHDVPTLLEALARVSVSHPDTILVLVGDGPTRTAMEERAHALGLSHAVRFTGLIGHRAVPDMIAAADIAVAPYPTLDRELWHSPLKLYEYMAAGATVVASRSGQVAQVLRDGRNGLLVPPGDPGALALALVRALDDGALRTKLGRQAREDAVTQHSWDGYVARLEDVFADAIARTGRAGSPGQRHRS